MTTNISADIRKIVLISMLKTFLLTVALSTAGLFIFFNEESKSFEGRQGVVLFSLMNFALSILLALASLTSLSISRKHIYTDKFMVRAAYFVPIILAFLLSLLVFVKSADRFSAIPLFATTPYLILWTVFYGTLNRRIRNLE